MKPAIGWDAKVVRVTIHKKLVEQAQKPINARKVFQALPEIPAL